ncbi:MAG: RDD family protein [Saprospiraceae bacterium]|nr:RDD family protein [Saprospiraceae bacterium]MBK7787843.1 RDD family protein [Saprospiraceae bacterium]MBK8109096.1 RDD family protein [Saprospiraceae bacterium]MBK8849985.1 RDD family protein [Saprospiraceae bacterium]MBK9686878.1 RDD family protein [Saprospiraceae bacterium]
MNSPTIKIVNPQNVVIEYTRATLGNRILARIIDLVIWYALIIVAGIAAGATGSWVLGIILFLPIFFYTFLTETLSNGQTPGKKTMSLRVIARDGGKLSSLALLLRWVMLLIDLWLTQGVAGIISIVVSKNGQRLGDLTADTYVISTQKPPSAATLNKFIDRADYEVSYPEAVQLSDIDIQTIRMVLNNRKINRKPLIEAAARKVEKVLEVQAMDNDAKFLQKIVLDNAYLERKARQEAAEWSSED